MCTFFMDEDIMTAKGMTCNERDEICNLSDGDFKAFLKPYGVLSRKNPSPPGSIGFSQAR